MNWKVIQKKYFKAFEKLKWFYENIPLEINEENVLGWYFTDGVHVIQMWNDLDRSWLYDFFDKQRLYIEVFIEEDYPIRWGWKVLTFQDDYGTNDYGNKSSLKTRKIAEEQAFIKSFQLLEEKLK